MTAAERPAMEPVAAIVLSTLALLDAALDAARASVCGQDMGGAEVPRVSGTAGTAH